MNNRNSRFVPKRENQAEELLSQLPPPLDGKAKSAAPGKTRAQLVFQGQLSPKKRRKIVRLEQWVEVRIVEGRTVQKRR